MRLTDRFKKAVGLWPPRDAYNTLRVNLNRDGDVAALRALLREYPDAVRWEKAGDMQPLRYALWQRSYAAAEALIEHTPAILEDKGPFGRTLLHEYAHRGEEKPLMFLLHQGADVNAVDEQGRTPLHLAAARQYGDDVWTPLLRYGAKHDRADKDGRTPLMVALMMGNTPAAQELLKKPYAAAQTDMYGRSLLMAAAESGMTSVIPTLLRAGVYAGHKNPMGETALDLAIRKKNGLAVLQLLQAHLPALDDKKRRKVGNLIRPIEGSLDILHRLGLRASPRKNPQAPKP